jgi:hypothetical protein
MIKNEEFKPLYNLYLSVWAKNHDDGDPACFEEWCDNELEELRESYRRYLKEAVIEDENFDETTTEDFYDFAEEEIERPLW